MKTKTKEKVIVTQKEISLLSKSRLHTATLAADLRKVEAEESALAKAMMNKLLEGADVEPGEYTASIEMKEGAVRPPWKDLYIDHMTVTHSLAPKAVEEEARGKFPAEKSPRLVIGVKAI
jgi:hypothetical protein